MKWFLLTLAAVGFFTVLTFRAHALAPETRAQLRPMANIVASVFTFLVAALGFAHAWDAPELGTTLSLGFLTILFALLVRSVQKSLITAILGQADQDTIYERGRKVLGHKDALRSMRALDGVEPRDPPPAKTKPTAASGHTPAPRPSPPVPVSEPKLIYWGHCSLPEAEAVRHFCIIGTVGSGKTITIRLLMRSVLPHIREGSNWRALIFDAKRDTLSRLAAMPCRAPIRILNPFDARAASWDIATDIASPAAAQYFAQLLIPEEANTSQPFFADAARHLLYGTIVALNEVHPREWTFRDVLLALRVPERIKTLLEKTPTTAEIVAQYFAEARTVPSIISTLATKLQRYEVIAALWQCGRGQKFSLESWLTEESVLVLGNHPSYKNSIGPINQAIFQRLVDLVLSQPDSASRRTYFFLDELREAGRLDGLWSLLNQGRSKGACVVIGFQDIEGLRAVYGDKVAHEIVGQCNNKTFLRTDSPPTAEWVERHFGQVQVRERPQGAQQVPRMQANIQGQYQRVVRSAVLASEIMGIPKTGPEHGLSALHDIPLVGFCYTTHVGFDQLQAVHAFDQDKNTRDEEPRPKSAELLAPWSDTDHKRLFGELPKPPEPVPEPKPVAPAPEPPPKPPEPPPTPPPAPAPPAPVQPARDPDPPTRRPKTYRPKPSTKPAPRKKTPLPPPPPEPEPSLDDIQRRPDDNEDP